MRHQRTAAARKKGSALVEIALSYAALVVVSLITLKATINASASQSWTVKQSMTDAYITQETALASRYPFDEITSASSLWPLTPSVSISDVVIGKLPGGLDVVAKLYRTRIPDPNNLSTAGGTGTETTNPSSTEAWQLQSILSYSVGDKDYVKTRTTLRIR